MPITLDVKNLEYIKKKQMSKRNGLRIFFEMMFSDIAWNLVCCKVIRFNFFSEERACTRLSPNKTRNLPSGLEGFAPENSGHG